ncbi:MAG: hypothetical protein ACOX6T_17530 [Myxococcales bacterium]|jgi:hypothetical protein
MRATVYQESKGRAAFGALALLALACLAASPACDRAKERPPARAAPRAGQSRGLTIHFSKLLPFAPESLLEYRGAAAVASTSRFGDVAVSEVERSYTNGDQKLKLRIVDTNINRGAKARPGEAFENDEKLGKPLLMASAVGYVELEKRTRRAQADLIVADRLLVTVASENADSTEAIERFCAGLDLGALARVVRDEPPAP